MRVVFLAYFFVSLIYNARILSAQENRPASPLSIEEIVQLHKAGFSDDVIVTRIRKNAKAFDLSADELLELKKIGLSDVIVRFLLDPSQPYSPPPPPAPATRTPDASTPAPPRVPNHFPADENAAKIPAEPGLYRYDTGSPVRIELKLLLGVKPAGGLGKMMKKDKGGAYLAGPVARSRTVNRSPVFYLRLAEGKNIEEILLIALEHKGDRREVEMTAKQELKPEVIRPFESVEVAPHLFRVTASKLTPGEYVFFQVGSAEPAKGVAGKGFDFGVDRPPAPAAASK